MKTDGPDSGRRDPSPLTQVEESGRTAAEAIERALSVLGADRNNVEVDILDEGSRGLLGIGGREARVRVTLLADRARAAETIARELLGLMGLSGEVSVEEVAESIRVNVGGSDVGSLIGKHGQTLAATETLLGLLLGRKLGAAVRVELDAEGYRERREASLQDLARRTADRVARQRMEIALTPMGPRDRRIIHVTLQEHPAVTTVSRGERDMRRVVVVPREGVASLDRPGRQAAPGTKQGNAEDAENTVESQLESHSSHRSGRSGRISGRSPRGTRSQGTRRGPGTEGPSGRRSMRPGPGGGFGKPSEVSGTRSAKGGRPDGLPVDEELEAEIEAYLAKTRSEDTKDLGETSESPSQKPETDEGLTEGK